MGLALNKKTLILITVIVIVVLIIVMAAWMIKKYIRANIASGGIEINKFFEERCSDPLVFNSRDFEWTAQFRAHWKEIREEFDAYSRNYVVPSYNDINRGSAGNTEGWKALFLRVFNNDTKMMEYFPKTKKILECCDCTTAYFSMLEPGTHIPEHKGIYKGVIRYHLGLIVPQKWEDCFIVVDGKKLHWKEGDDIMFDDMVNHHVENNTSEKRVVLFLDVKRDFGSLFLNAVNRLMLKYIKCNDALVSTVDKVNILSRQTPERYQVMTAQVGDKTTYDKVSAWVEERMSSSPK